MKKIIFYGLFIILLPLVQLQTVHSAEVQDAEVQDAEVQDTEVQGAEVQKEFAPDQWHFIGIPCSTENLAVEDVFSGLPDDGWAFHRYDGSGYTEINDTRDQLEPGVGYLFSYQGAGTVEASVTCENSVAVNRSLSPESWHTLANPYITAIALADISLNGTPITDSIATENVSSLWVYRNGDYVQLRKNGDLIEPWEAFWIYNYRTETAELLFGEAAQVPVKAFPTAEGAGASAVGGRGGKVIQVTNLNDAGPGSLRECAESTGPRNCVFRVGGTITIQKEITVKSPYLTIAGQTAPGGGITIRMTPNVSSEVLKIQTHDVIVRYLRLRPGGSSVRKDNQRGLSVFNRNPGNVYNVIIDHCSIGWSSDEVAIAWYDARDITFQWSIFHEGFACASHTEDCNVSRSKGLLVGSEETADHPASGDISIHHNIFVHHGERGPRLANGGVADVVNNVAYNMRYSAMQATNRGSNPALRNFVGNLFIKGPNSESDSHISPQQEVDGNELEIYIKGNIGPLRTDDSMDEELAVKKQQRFPWRTLQRHPAQPITTHECTSLSECELKDIVLARSGASFPKRDAVDKRIIAEIESLTGQEIDAQSETECFFGCSKYLTPSDYTIHGITDPIDNRGYPVLDAGVPYTDSDNDGMSDEWERQNGLDPLDGTDHIGDIDQNGYTNLEDFLNNSDGIEL